MKNFRMPAEWETHLRSWVIWPCRTSIWGDQLDAAKRSFEQVIRAIARFEEVIVIATPELVAEAEARFEDLLPRVQIFAAEVDDSWARDILPMFMTADDGACHALNWRFNAWGEKFSPYEKDQALGQTIVQALLQKNEIDTGIDIEMILEGGSVHFDGEGTLLTTKQCLLNANRNPTLTQSEIEAELKNHFNVDKVIWLDEGLWGDTDTDGHVDVIAAFTQPGTIITLYSEDKNHPNFEIYARNKAILAAETDAKGRPFNLIEIPQPMTVLWEDQPLPLSYINFYIINGAVLVPTFDDPHDEQALEAFKQAFPQHEIIPIDALPIFRGGGGIHCITLQQPARATLLEESL